jgi:hypothetical protein
MSIAHYTCIILAFDLMSNEDYDTDCQYDDIEYAITEALHKFEKVPSDFEVSEFNCYDHYGIKVMFPMDQYDADKIQDMMEGMILSMGHNARMIEEE